MAVAMVETPTGPPLNLSMMVSNILLSVSSRPLFEDDDSVVVMTYSGLTADFARSMGAAYIVKGVRSVRDFEAEREQADINRMLTGVETILLPAEPGLDSVSSTVVRELSHFGKDVSPLLPHKDGHDD